MSPKRRSFDLGKMRHRIRVYATHRTDDGSGGYDRSDPSGADHIGDFWGYIEPVSARERQWGDQYTEVTTHRCWLRYNPLVKEGMVLRRIAKNSITDYHIESIVDPDGTQEYHLLMLREGGPM